MSTQVHIERDIAVPMRDGTLLSTDIYRPPGNQRRPALLLRTPYSKDIAQTISYAHPVWYASQGFVVAVQDTRGRFKSEGSFYPLRHEAADTLDTLAWLRSLPFVRPDKIGMYGYSYPGWCQLLAAARDSPSLAAIAPAFCSSGFYKMAYTNGAINLAALESYAVQVALMEATWKGDRDAYNVLTDALKCPPCLYSQLPLKALAPLRRTGLSHFFFDVLEHPEREERFWDDLEVREEEFANIDVPALHIGGWYDTFIAETTKNFERLSRRRDDQYLLIGPWFHMPWAQRVGEVDFGEMACNIVDQYQQHWFTHWLVNDGKGPLAMAKVRIFVMGKNEWRNEDQWPPSRARETMFFLHSRGRANSLSGDGVLAKVPPSDEPEDVFVYNPLYPVPSLGGNSCCFPDLAPMGPYDQRPIEGRNDVLVYTSEALTSPLEVTGRIWARLFVSSSAETTDFTIKLLDVYPDGRAINLCDSIFRSNGHGRPGESLLPGGIRELSFEIGVTSNWFGPGHRIRVEVSSSNFPMYDRNLNSPQASDEFGAMIATQRVYHDSAFPSAVILPVIEQNQSKSD